MDKTVRMSLLFDFYGPLLTKRQQHIYQLYFDHDLSLAEIGDQLQISRQGVHDILKRSEATLEDFEAKLQLLVKHAHQVKMFRQLEQECVQLQTSLSQLNLGDQANRLGKMQEILKQILAES